MARYLPIIARQTNFKLKDSVRCNQGISSEKLLLAQLAPENKRVVPMVYEYIQSYS